MNSDVNFIKDAKYMLGLYDEAMSDGHISSLAQKELDEVICFAETRANNGIRHTEYCVRGYLNPKPIAKTVIKMLKERGFKAKFVYSKTFNCCNIIMRW